MKNSLKRNSYTLFILSISGLAFFSSCKKPKTGITTITDNSYVPDKCVPVYFPPNISPDSMLYPPTGYGWPDFNPNDKNEFVCIEGLDSLPDKHLCTYNMKTGIKKILTSGKFMYQPKWGSTGWIVFTAFPDKQLWIIKCNGDSLTQITNSPTGTYCYFPDWSPDGKKIIFSNGGSYRIIDKVGNVLKDYNSGFLGGIPLWAPDGIHVAGGSKIVNLNNNESLIYSYGILRWFPDEKSWLTSDTSGVFVYHSQSNKLQRIAWQCNSRQYSFFSISNDGKQILADRDTRKFIGPNTTWQEEDIVIMNADGSGEKVVKIPN